MEILFPSEREQIAIFSGMNEETQAPEQHLGKPRQIKQRMMQELLMGKMQLIKGEAHG